MREFNFYSRGADLPTVAAGRASGGKHDATVKPFKGRGIKYGVTLSLRLVLLSCLISHVSCLSAQEERGLTRDGNKLFQKEKYADAEAAYKKALEKKNNFPEAIFNLGDAMYQQGRYDDAIKQFELSSKMITDTMQRAASYHNLGNCQLQKKEYESAVTAYKQALRLNPADKDTKYNLAYANAMLKNPNQNQKNKQNQKQDQQNKDNKDKKDDKGDKDKKGQQDQKDKQGQGDKDKEDQKQQQKNRGNLSKEQAEKLLQALSPEEQKTLEKMQKKKEKPQDVKIEKDW